MSSCPWYAAQCKAVPPSFQSLQWSVLRCWHLSHLLMLCMYPPCMYAAVCFRKRRYIIVLPRTSSHGCFAVQVWQTLGMASCIGGASMVQLSPVQESDSGCGTTLSICLCLILYQTRLDFGLTKGSPGIGKAHYKKNPDQLVSLIEDLSQLLSHAVCEFCSAS